MTDKKGNVEKVSSKRIFGYVIGTIPLVLIMGFFNIAYVNFFYDDLKLNETFWILGLIIYAIVNAINDPLIGQMSDSTNVKKWGSRRIIYIKIVSPILMVAFVLMWFPWSLDNQVIIFLHFVIIVCAYDTVLNIVVMTWMALLPDMTKEIDERTKIGFISGVIGFFTGLFVLIVPYIMNNRELLQIGAIIIALISIICYMLVVKFSKESPEFQHEKIPPLWDSIKQTLKSRSFRCYIVFGFMTILNLSIGLSYLFLYMLIIGEENVIWYLLLSIVVGYSSNIICMKLRPKYGIKKIMKTYMPLQIIGGMVSFFIILNPITQWFLWIGVIWTSFFGGSGVFNTALQTLPIDEDEVEFGSRRETMFYGVNALLTMWAYSIGPMIATAILSATNYVKNAPLAAQPGTAIVGIKILFFLVPQIFAFIGLIFILLYPMEKLESTAFQEKLELLHRQKRERLSSAGSDAVT